jgi:hypothetical protein
MKSDYDIFFLKLAISKHRQNYLKRKNVNNWKTNGINTPDSLDKLLNCFDRKIKGFKIFTPEVKNQYLKELNVLFSDYYLSTFEPKYSKIDSYNNYLAVNIKYSGKGRSKKNNLNELLTFKEFIKSGLKNKYKSYERQYYQLG